MKSLTKKEVLKKHKKSPKNKHSLSLRDKSLHKIIETGKIKKETFNKLIQQGTKQEPFDKKNKI